MPVSPSAAAMMYGVLASVLFNLSKGMQRQGIGAISFLVPKRRADRTAEARPASAKTIALYATGFVLNNSMGLFAILANRHAPASYFTSMFGTGLIALMLYSGFILKEPVRPRQYAGAVVLTLGTLILGYDGIIRPPMTLADIHPPAAGIVLAVSFLAGGVLLFYAGRRNRTGVRVLTFGLLIGFAASLDPLLKGIGQNLGGRGGYLPKLSLGWLIFLASFLFTFLSFTAAQLAFGQGIEASRLIPSQTFAYITYPILFQAAALPGFDLTRYTVLGLAVTVLGMIVMQAPGRRNRPRSVQGEAGEPPG